MKLFLLFISLLVFKQVACAQTTEELVLAAAQKLGQNKLHDATALIDKAISLDEANSELYSFKAELEYKLDNPEGVLKNIYKAISLDPKSSMHYNSAANYFNSYGYNDSAVVMFNRAANYAENDTIFYSILNNRSSALVYMHEYKAARKDIEKCLAKFPENVGFLNNAAIIYWYSKVPEKTFACLDKAALLDTSFAGTFINLGMYHTESGNFQKALSNFNIALELTQNTNSVTGPALLYSNRGHLYYKMGEHTQALKDLNKSLNGYPTNSYAYRNRALVYLALNKNTEACRDLEAALYHGFTKTYGDEVKNLSRKNCK